MRCMKKHVDMAPVNRDDYDSDSGNDDDDDAASDLSDHTFLPAASVADSMGAVRFLHSTIS